ncbi:hypothetical protein 10S7_11 [uncultured Caudovirales phage]|uniref:Mor transcription activator domain-containing protein n=1 Tax=uncultured Caudovirales phage TaxID=2100421 RepID=A0A2H4JHA5_9CAUD|nr:hypothetical protein 10S7_11 [uncultured Caudovirales phage]
MDTFESELTLDMISEGMYRDIAEEIGVLNFLKVAKLVGGTTFYIPKAESLMRPVRDLHIKKEFNGYNHLELAQRYDVTERWVRQICGDGSIEGQVTIFDIGCENDMENTS